MFLNICWSTAFGGECVDPPCSAQGFSKNSRHTPSRHCVDFHKWVLEESVTGTRSHYIPPPCLGDDTPSPAQSCRHVPVGRVPSPGPGPQAPWPGHRHCSGLSPQGTSLGPGISCFVISIIFGALFINPCLPQHGKQRSGGVACSPEPRVFLPLA